LILQTLKKLSQVPTEYKLLVMNNLLLRELVLVYGRNKRASFIILHTIEKEIFCICRSILY